MAQGQVQEPRGGRAECTGARVRGRARQGGARAPGARRQGVVQLAAGAESAQYLDFRPGDRALLRRQVSIRALGVSRFQGFGLGGTWGRVALGASRLPNAAAAATAAAAAVAAAVLGGVAEQTVQAHCGGRGRAGTHRHAASGLGACGSLTCGRCRRRPAPDLGISPSGQRRGGGRVNPRLGLGRELWVLGAAPWSRSPRPPGTEGPRAPSFFYLGWGGGRV